MDKKEALKSALLRGDPAALKSLKKKGRILVEFADSNGEASLYYVLGHGFLTKKEYELIINNND